MIELEKKIMLNEQEYDFIRKSLIPFDSDYIQKNHYYDTEDLSMMNAGITCRIREKKNTYSVEIKQHCFDWHDVSVENLESVHCEYNDSFFKKMGLKKHGVMKTYRNTLKRNNVEIMLDKNDYLDLTDYELEVEYSTQFENEAIDELYHIAEALRNECLIETISNFLNRIGTSDNKSHRFFKRKQSKKLQKAD